MSVESVLMTALAATSLPIAQDVYTGTATTYITFNYWTVPIWIDDDTPTYEQVKYQVHLFAPKTTDLTAYKAQIKTLLFAAGYTYPGTINMSDEVYGPHIVFDTEKREAI